MAATIQQTQLKDGETRKNIFFVQFNLIKDIDTTYKLYTNVTYFYTTKLNNTNTDVLVKNSSSIDRLNENIDKTALQSIYEDFGSLTPGSINNLITGKYYIVFWPTEKINTEEIKSLGPDEQFINSIINKIKSKFTSKIIDNIYLTDNVSITLSNKNGIKYVAYKMSKYPATPTELGSINSGVFALSIKNYIELIIMFMNIQTLQFKDNELSYIKIGNPT